MQPYTEIEALKSLYKSIRTNIDAEFHKVYQQAVRMGAAVNVEPSKPRSCSRQRNRPNIVTESTEEWYKVNVAIPFFRSCNYRA